MLRPSVWISISPSQQVADAGAGMRVQVGDAAEREVDAVAADDPLREGVELDVAREERALGLLGRGVELPHEGVAVDGGGAEVRLATRDVVDDAVAADRLGARRGLVEGEPQWKVCPPSITIVCPVTKSEPGPDR